MARSNLLELPEELLEEIANRVPDEDLNNALRASSLLTKIFTKKVYLERVSKLLININESALSKDRREILALLHLEEVRRAHNDKARQFLSWSN